MPFAFFLWAFVWLSYMWIWSDFDAKSRPNTIQSMAEWIHVEKRPTIEFQLCVIFRFIFFSEALSLSLSVSLRLLVISSIGYRSLTWNVFPFFSLFSSCPLPFHISYTFHSLCVVISCTQLNLQEKIVFIRQHTLAYDEWDPEKKRKEENIQCSTFFSIFFSMLFKSK